MANLSLIAQPFTGIPNMLDRVMLELLLLIRVPQ